MHDQGVRLGDRKFDAIKAKEPEIFACRRHVRSLHPLGLQAQHHDDVRIPDAIQHVVMNLYAELFDCRRQQRFRSDQPDVGAHGIQQVDIRARHAGMQDIAADSDRQPLERLLAPPDGQRVEQCLGRVFVAAVPGIDDRAGNFLAQQLDRAGIAVADGQNIGVHGVQGHRRVDKRLALLDGAGTDRHVDHVGPESLAGKLERCAGTGRIFEKDVYQCAAAQDGAFFVVLAALLDIRFREVQKSFDLFPWDAFHAENMHSGRVKARIVCRVYH